ncbi:acyl-CoA carboxylase subunit epsilon, partial [Nocardiopsis gilva]
MTADTSLVVVRGNPDTAELAALTVVLTAVLRGSAAPAPAPAPAP